MVGAFSVGWNVAALDHSSWSRVRLLLVLEGKYDVRFLKRVSALWHGHDPTYPDLETLEARGDILFLPIGGHLDDWTHRLASLACREWYLFDREVGDVSLARRKIVAAINEPPGCVAALTSMRALENYLNPSAIEEVCGVSPRF